MVGFSKLKTKKCLYRWIDAKDQKELWELLWLFFLVCVGIEVFQKKNNQNILRVIKHTYGIPLRNRWDKLLTKTTWMGSKGIMWYLTNKHSLSHIVQLAWASETRYMYSGWHRGVEAFGAWKMVSGAQEPSTSLYTFGLWFNFALVLPSWE